MKESSDEEMLGDPAHDHKVARYTQNHHDVPIKRWVEHIQKDVPGYDIGRFTFLNWASYHNVAASKTSAEAIGANAFLINGDNWVNYKHLNQEQKNSIQDREFGKKFFALHYC